MKKSLQITSICQCNKLLGEKTFHPLISVIDLSKTENKYPGTLQTGFYTLLLTEYTCDRFMYGRKKCDYSDGTVLFLSPGNSFQLEEANLSASKGWLLMIHPELMRSTNLEIYIHDYTFFSYTQEEALHISEREKKIFMRCLENIREELHQTIDKHSRIVLTKYIELLLDYCLRFYDRQFITRSEENTRLIKKTEKIVCDYFMNNHIQGLPSANYCAALLRLSPVYFSDLLKQETGMSLHEYAESKRIEIAKRWLNETDKSIAQIAGDLGYSSTRYFSRLFTKLTGYSPRKFKSFN